MLWIIPAWVVSLIAAGLLGYYLRGLKKRIEQVEEVLKSKVDKKPEEPEPVSTLIDPTDPIKEAMYQHQKEMERLNGQNS